MNFGIVPFIWYYKNLIGEMMAQSARRSEMEILESLENVRKFILLLSIPSCFAGK